MRVEVNALVVVIGRIQVFKLVVSGLVERSIYWSL